jgi:large subunit ribosomal protein L28
MAFKCDNCGKGIAWGHRVSHAKNRTNYAFKPNIQKKKVKVGGRFVSMKLCTNCIKTLKKVNKAKVSLEPSPLPDIHLQSPASS